MQQNDSLVTGAGGTRSRAKTRLADGEDDMPEIEFVPGEPFAFILKELTACECARGSLSPGTAQSAYQRRDNPPIATTLRLAC